VTPIRLGRIRFSETETGFSLVSTVLCTLLCETKPVFETIETILGHGFAGFAAETLPCPLVYWFARADES